MSKIKKLMITSLCVALGVIVPMAFHFVQNAGAVFCPMHIPVLMCAIICGWKYGLVCGVMAPVLSSLLTGMPPMAIMPFMVVELGVYGLVAGVLNKKISTNNMYCDLYISLLGAMLIGRIINGVVRAIALSGSYSLSIWLTASFVTCLPGIILQLLLIPSLIMILIKSKLIPNKYSVK